MSASSLSFVCPWRYSSAALLFGLLNMHHVLGSCNLSSASVGWGLWEHYFFPKCVNRSELILLLLRFQIPSPHPRIPSSHLFYVSFGRTSQAPVPVVDQNFELAWISSRKVAAKTTINPGVTSCVHCAQKHLVQIIFQSNPRGSHRWSRLSRCWPEKYFWNRARCNVMTAPVLQYILLLLHSN